MGKEKLQEKIEQVGIMLYQNKEQKALESFGRIFPELKRVSDILLALPMEEEERENLERLTVTVFRELLDGYKQKDMLCMADCLMGKASLLVGLYTKIQTSKDNRA